MKFSFVALFLLLVIGCAAPTESRSATPQEDPSVACFRAASTDSRTDILEPKVGLKRNAPPSIEMLSNTDIANESERVAIKVWADNRQRCVEMGKSFRQSALSLLANIAIDTFDNKVLLLIAKLYSGEITFGTYHSERVRAVQERGQAFAEIERLSAQEQNSRAFVAESQRQQANQDLLNGLMLLQRPAVRPSLNPPVNCTSQRFGNAVQTTCQ